MVMLYPQLFNFEFIWFNTLILVDIDYTLSYNNDSSRAFGVNSGTLLLEYAFYFFEDM